VSGYPPGVTGREYQISGPDMEWEETRTCTCGYTGPVFCYESRYERWWQCPEPVPAHAVERLGVTGKLANGEWGTVGYSCLRCGVRVEDDTLARHPASGGCGAYREMHPASQEQEADEAERKLEADVSAAFEAGESAGEARGRLVGELEKRRPDLYRVLMGRSMVGTYGDARRRE